MRSHFVVPGHRKKQLVQNSFSDVLLRLMGLRIHNLPFGCLKKLFWKSMKRCFNVSKGQAFSQSSVSKKATWRCCLSNV
jgi:hypothetical protein